MKVLMMQHGKPVPEEENPERPLSEEGRRQVETVARFLKRSGMKIEAALHSGKTRARETADIVASILNPAVEPREQRGLSPLDEVKEVARRIEETEEDLLVCGHLPHLAKLTSFLVTGEESFPVAKFQQGGVLCLERDDGRKWSIAWMIVPEILG